MNSQIKVIFFDVGNTLLFPNRDRVHAPLVERGVGIKTEHLRDLERRTKNKFDSLMIEDGNHDHGFWRMFYTQLFAEIGLDDSVLCDRLINNIRDSGNWDQIRSGTRQKLNEIAKHYRIGVISNADGRIDAVLRRCNICDCFLSITDSGLVGYEKPHPEIFVQALKTLNAAPQESLYVGDVYSVDYLGATGAGMHAVLMDVSGAYQHKGVPRVESLDQLQQWLGDQEAAQ